MRRLALGLVLLFAACSNGSIIAVEAEKWQPRSPELQAKSASFLQVSNAVGDAARKECRRRSNTVNCDFVILVDINPTAEANAFQTLGDDGQPLIIFTQAMIASTNNADEMAFVMGHEAAHHILGHIAQQAQNARESARIFGDLARVQGDSGAGIERAQELGAKVGTQAYSRAFELEADQFGTRITHDAGYDPLIGLRYFQRIPDPGDVFFASHPPNAQRVEAVIKTARGLGLSP